MATIVDSRKRIPFLRGMLTHYLLEQGLTFQEAYVVSDSIRSDIQKQKTVSANRMVALVQEHAKKVVGDRPVGDCVFWAPRSRQILVEDEGRVRSFSRERLSDSLVVAGLDDEEAYSLAQRIEADFVRADRTSVSGADIRKVAGDMLKSTFGEAYAARYRAWKDFRTREQTRPLVVLIGGASGVGKTSSAVALANLLNISRVASTDQIRQVMRLMISPDLMPALHTSSYLAWQAVAGNSMEQLIPAYREQSQRVCVGVRASIERAIDENVNLIIDGVHLLPDLLDLKPYKATARFIQINLHISDPDVFRERFETRGRTAGRRQNHRYLEHLDQILGIQQHLLEVGDRHGVAAIENHDLEESVQSMVVLIMDALRADQKKNHN